MVVKFSSAPTTISDALVSKASLIFNESRDIEKLRLLSIFESLSSTLWINLVSSFDKFSNSSSLASNSVSLVRRRLLMFTLKSFISFIISVKASCFFLKLVTQASIFFKASSFSRVISSVSSLAFFRSSSTFLMIESISTSISPSCVVTLVI